MRVETEEEITALEAWRRAKGLSTTSAAKLLGVSRPSLAALLRGGNRAKKISLDLAARVAEATGIDLELIRPVRGTPPRARYAMIPMIPMIPVVAGIRESQAIPVTVEAR